MEIKLKKRAVYAGDVHTALLQAGVDIETANNFVAGLATANSELETLQEQEIHKIRTPFAQVICRQTWMGCGLYYEIQYYNPEDKEIHVGFGSYEPDFVYTWLAEFFEIDRNMGMDFTRVIRCRDCKHYRNHPNGLCYAWTEPKCTPKGYSGEAHMVEPDDFCSCGERRE